MSIALRPATLADLEWLDALHTACMRETVERLYPWRPDQFRETFDPAVNHVIVVDGVDAGLLSRYDEPDAIRIGNLLVAPEHQRRGIGTTVLRGVLAESARRCVAVRLRVLRGNSARELYERLGFTVTEETSTAFMMSTSAISIRPMTSEDWSAVRVIYEEGIATRNATFETSAPDWDAWDAGHIDQCRLVAADAVGLLGWAVLSAVSSRCVYGGVAEISVYIAARARGRGVGRALLERIVEESELHGFWTLQAGILAENEASRRLHRSCGFREIGTRERIGRLDGHWRDVVLMERRSRVVGV